MFYHGYRWGMWFVLLGMVALNAVSKGESSHPDEIACFFHYFSFDNVFHNHRLVDEEMCRHWSFLSSVREGCEWTKVPFDLQGMSLVEACQMTVEPKMKQRQYPPLALPPAAEPRATDDPRPPQNQVPQPPPQNQVPLSQGSWRAGN